MRQTPLPLLRFLPPNELVLRCAQCKELVLARECCQDQLSAAICPRRAVIEQQPEASGIPSTGFKLAPAAAVRNLNA